mmetsp:Transcript_29085/g.81397  ORF Transcript_29085/g.81397 Transcript_29085/m.81397 type:complete len:750 (+) Transcript_29085:379-2628(+)
MEAAGAAWRRRAPWVGKRAASFAPLGRRPGLRAPPLGLGGGQEGAGHAERGHRHVVEGPRLVQAADGARVPPLLAADADLQPGGRGPAPEGGRLHEAQHRAVERLEGVLGQDALLAVGGQEGAAVVPGNAHRHLRQVVGAEREEARARLHELLRRQARPRGLHHAPHAEGQLGPGVGQPLAGERLLGGLVDEGLAHAHLFAAHHQGHHDAHGPELLARLPQLLPQAQRGVHEGAHLHLQQGGARDEQAAATQAQHGVLLPEGPDAARQGPLVRAQGGGQLAGVVAARPRQELVQRGVEEADDHGQARHLAQDPAEVLLLVPLELVQGLLLSRPLGEDRPPHGQDPGGGREEHVLRAAEADAARPELAGGRCVLGRVGVGLDPQPFEVLQQLEEAFKGAVHGGGLARHAAEDHLARRAIDRDPVALLQGAPREGHLARTFADRHLRQAADAGLPPPSGDDGRVAGHPAAGREDALASVHPPHVVRAGLVAHQDHLLVLLAPRRGGRGREHDLAHRRPGAGGEPRAQDAPLLAVRSLVRPAELGQQQLGQVFGGDHVQRCPFVHEALLDEVQGDSHRRAARALPPPGLQHPELAFLDGELHVLHVFEVLFQRRGGPAQLLEALRESLGQGRDGLRRPHARHNVFALRVDEELAVEPGRPRARVPAEAHAGGRVLRGVAVHHHLNVDGRAQEARKPLHATVLLSPFVPPGGEHRFDRRLELHPGVLRHGPRVDVDDLLELGDEGGEVLFREL